AEKCAPSDRVQSGFSGADADGLFDLGDENLAVADTPGLGGAADRVDRAVDEVVADHDLDLHLGQEIHDVFGAAIEFGMSLLPAETLGFGDSNALQSELLKRFFHLVELERLDDGFDLLHLSASRAFPDPTLQPCRQAARMRRAVRSLKFFGPRPQRPA